MSHIQFEPVSSNLEPCLALIQAYDLVRGFQGFKMELCDGSWFGLNSGSYFLRDPMRSREILTHDRN
jgi:hypothetical protein